MFRSSRTSDVATLDKSWLNIGGKETSMTKVTKVIPYVNFVINVTWITTTCIVIYVEIIFIVIFATPMGYINITVLTTT